MVNPRNAVTLTGTIRGNVKSCEKNGEIYAYCFYIGVQNSYRSKKTNQYDMIEIPVMFRCLSDAVKKFASDLSNGDKIQLIGTLSFGMYQGRKTMFVSTSSLTLDEDVRAEKYEKLYDKPEGLRVQQKRLPL